MSGKCGLPGKGDNSFASFLSEIFDDAMRDAGGDDAAVPLAFQRSLLRHGAKDFPERDLRVLMASLRGPEQW